MGSSEILTIYRGLRCESCGYPLSLRDARRSHAADFWFVTCSDCAVELVEEEEC